MLVIPFLFGAVPIQAFSGDGTDIALHIRVNDQTNEIVVRPNDEVRVNFLATNNGPDDVNFLGGATIGLIENFSFPLDIDCQDLGIRQGRGSDPTDYAIVWRISPLAVGEINERQFSLRALGAASENELIQIQYVPSSPDDPDPSNDVGSILVTFERLTGDPIAVPILSAKTLGGFCIRYACSWRSKDTKSKERRGQHGGFTSVKKQRKERAKKEKQLGLLFFVLRAMTVC